MSRKGCIIALVTIHDGFNPARRRPSMTVFSSNRLSCAGQRLGAHVLGKVQIRNAKEVIWDIVSVYQHGTATIQRRKAANKRAALAPQMNGASSETRYTRVSAGVVRAKKD